MASQQVYVFSVAGACASKLWSDFVTISDNETRSEPDVIQPENWNSEDRTTVDRVIEALVTNGILPPVLFRSEHIDYWSMGDVFASAIVKPHRDWTRRICTDNYELFATWCFPYEKLDISLPATDEERLLFQLLNEAITARKGLVERRLVILVRKVLGGLWTDDELAQTLHVVPGWLS